MKSIGIIGGMGPLATADLYRKITILTNAASDAEHIRIYIDSNTSIPDRTEAIANNGTSPVAEMIASATKLEAIGADFLIIACNTAHYFYEQVANSVSIPVLNMVDECADEASNMGLHSIGLLTTSGVRKTHLYENAFHTRGIQTLLPTEEEQACVTAMIYDCVKASNFEHDITEFKQLLKTLQERGAQALLLGCTELPIAFSHFAFPYTILDPTTILAKSAIRFAGYTVK